MANYLSEEVLSNYIQQYLKGILDTHVHKEIASPKVIHDSVHGSNLFLPFEIALIDLPFVQRLRRISQTDVASLIYPAGNHTRFEHTIGVASIVAQMVEAIFSKNSGLLTDIDKTSILHHCKAAAILHDVGHGPFSHLSEQIYGHHYKEIRKNPKFSGASPHEIVSYFITTSRPMKDFCRDVIANMYHVTLDLDFVGEMIIGYVDHNAKEDRAFAIELINGAFDADKLDYIMRDAHATGINMALDIQRLLYTMDVVQDHEGCTRLSVDISGTSALEEIIFNKMLLNNTIYHHQKVRAAGCLLKSIISETVEYNDPLCFIGKSDDDIYARESVNITRLKSRILPKRALCISARTIINKHKLEFLTKSLEDEENKQQIIRLIAERSGISSEEVWIDVPGKPKFKEANQCIIRSQGSSDNQVTLRDIFPTDDWVKAFSENKWQCFVYTLADHCDAVSKEAKDVIGQVFDVTFNDFAIDMCKIR